MDPLRLELDVLPSFPDVCEHRRYNDQVKSEEFVPNRS